MLLKEITKSVKWVLPHGKDLQADFDEYKKKETKKWEARAKQIGATFPLFNDLEEFEAALKAGRIFTLDKSDWTDIRNLSYNRSLDDLKDLVSSYVVARDVDRIVKGIEEGAILPLPIVLKGKNGRWIMAGNTRLNVARIMGVPQKAVEIDVSKKHLQELVGFIPDLFEVLDTKFDTVEWHSKEGSSLEADAFLGDKEFKLYIEVENLKFGKNITWLNIAFARIVDGEAVQELIGSNSQQSKALGSVINALKQKIAELDAKYQIDALVFVAVSTELKRLSLYRRLITSKLYGLSGWREIAAEVDAPNGRAIIATKGKLGKDNLAALKAEVAVRGKTLI